MNNKLLVGVIVLTMGTLFSCANPGKVTGGGQLIDYYGDRVANFGFNGDTCDGDLNNPKGHFNYIDQTHNVKMNGPLISHGTCVSPDQWQGEWYSTYCDLCQNYFEPPVDLFFADYRSTNPQMRGDGEVMVCAKDNGEGQAATSDQIHIEVFSGPFAYYNQTGFVKGNIKAHSCDEE
jgi:hypothetical protein